MGEQDNIKPLKEAKYIASVDLGSHTARFLVGKIYEPPILFMPVARKRFYTNLAEGFNQKNPGVINSDSCDRAVDAIEDFIKIAERYSVDKIVGAATGIFRRAKNSESLLSKIKERTGVDIITVSGEDEADLTMKGVFHALELSDYPDVFFDLGGSTTEFIYKSVHKKKVISLPIGAFVLNEMFFKNDPPYEEEVRELKYYVVDILKKKIDKIVNSRKEFSLIGSGGTVTSLAAIIMDLDMADVNPGNINGRTLGIDKICNLYDRLKTLNFSDRLKIKSIDEGRAKVILAGTLAVVSIMEFLKANNLTVSYSDILEGLILSYIEGEKDE